MWIPGRQGTGYFKFKIFSFICVDAYILKYPTNAFISYHYDKVPGKKHYRLNIRLPFGVGGHLRIRGRNSNLHEIALFRPDIDEHKVTKVRKGTVYALSFGFTRNVYS